MQEVNMARNKIVQIVVVPEGHKAETGQPIDKIYLLYSNGWVFETLYDKDRNQILWDPLDEPEGAQRAQ
jgi:hypothetical protein